MPRTAIRSFRHYAAILLLSLVAATHPMPAQQSSAAPPLSLQSLGRATIPLNGPWQFHSGDDLAWAVPTLDDSTWQTIEAGQPWEAQGHYGLRGFAWYRRHLDLGPNPNPSLDLALLLPSVEDACEIYWNGKLIGSYGRVPPDPYWFPLQFPQQFSLGPAHSGVLAIRVWKAPVIYVNYPFEGGLTGVPLIGTRASINALQDRERYRFAQSSYISTLIATVSAVVGLLALFFWLRNRNRLMLLWLAIVMLYPLGLLVLTGTPSIVTFKVFYGLIAEVVVINAIATWFLLLDLLELRDNPRIVRWTRLLSPIILGLTLVDTIMSWVDWTRLFPNLFVFFDVGSTVPIELLELYGIVIVFTALRKKLDPARWTLATAIIVSSLFQASTDLSGLGARWTHWTLAQKLNAPIAQLFGKPLDARTVVAAFLLVSILYAVWRYSLQQSRRQDALELEFHSAQEVQQILISDALPVLPAYTVTSAYCPALEVGGDFFQIIPLEDQSAIVILGDVSGKGLRAAMAVALIVGAARTLAEWNPSPASILEGLNRRLHGRLNGGFATCLILRLHPDGACAIANAGHLSPFLNATEFPVPPSLPLGIDPDTTYETSTIQLQPTDVLALFTDGLLEARSPTGELFGFERLAPLFVGNPPAEKLMHTAQAFGQDDDITILTIAFTPEPPREA